jgi:hypothetical protein
VTGDAGDPYRRWRLAILTAVPLVLVAGLVVGYLLFGSALVAVLTGTSG